MSTDVVVNNQMSTQSSTFINLLLGPKTSSNITVDYSRSLKTNIFNIRRVSSSLALMDDEFALAELWIYSFHPKKLDRRTSWPLFLFLPTAPESGCLRLVKMGIPGLLQFIKDAAEPISIKKYRGQTVAVDTYCWLHKGAFACAEQLAKGEPTDQ